MATTKRSEAPPPFIANLYRLAESGDRAALAELRQSLVSGNDWRAARHVFPWLGTRAGPRRESAALLVAGLFGMYQKSTSGPNFGHSMGRVWQEQDKRLSTEQRFVALLNISADDLPYYLRQAVSLIASYDIPVDWEQLYRDLYYWSHTDRFIQRKWARAFWGAPSPTETQPAKEED
jgi:CRISPR system Cascade subunit CasB